MANSYKILKVNIINSIGINKILKEESKREKIKLIAMAVCIGIAIITVAYLPFMYAILMAILGSSMFTFFTSVYKAQEVLFSAKDYEMLMALPIKPRVILLSKMIQLLLLNYLFVALILIPPAIVYFTRVNISTLFFVYLVIEFIFAPLISIVVASIIAFILSYVLSRVRHKNLVIILGSFIVTILIMLVSNNANSIIDMVTINSEAVNSAVSKAYPPAIYFKDALAHLDVLNLFKFVIVSIIPFLIFLFVFSKFYNNINAKLSESFKSSNYKLTTLKTTSKMKALIIKELKAYFACPIYVLNTSFALVLITIVSIASLFFGGDVIANLLKVPEVKNILPQLMIGVLSVVVCMSCTTNLSISLEGKELWILKSSPIDAIDIFKGKIAVNLIILIPIILLNSVILLVSLKMNLISFLWLIIIPTLYAFVISILGIFINLYFPKLEWISEVTVVKQSLSAMLAPLLGMILVAIPVGILILFKVSNVNLYLVILSVV